MMLLLIYLRSQLLSLFLYLVLVLIPFVLVCVYFPEIPYGMYFFLIILFLIKLLVLNDSAYSKKIHSKVQSELAKELKRNASSNEIYQRIAFHQRSRDFNLLLIGTIIIIIAIYFGKMT